MTKIWFTKSANGTDEFLVPFGRFLLIMSMLNPSRCLSFAQEGEDLTGEAVEANEIRKHERKSGEARGGRDEESWQREKRSRRDII